MHNYAHGLGGKHIWPEIMSYIMDEFEGRDYIKAVDTQLVDYMHIKFNNIDSLNSTRQMPSWHKLNHFENIVDIHYSNANKYEDILQVCEIMFLIRTSHNLSIIQIALFVTHDILVGNNYRGYLLLCLLQSYLFLDTYASLEVYTMDTLELGQKELERYSLIMEVSNSYFMALDSNSLYIYYVGIYQGDD